MKTLKHLLSITIAALFVSALPYVAFGQMGQNEMIQFLRPYDFTGANTFEMPKQTNVVYDGFAIKWGAAFRQQWQSLNHENDADPVLFPDNVLSELGPGFNTANANLFLDAQLAEGVRVHVTTYLSSRHHREAWVKGGYLQFDAFPMLNSPALDALMENVRIKVGHYEINYGDQHYRRSDNAQAIYNPFVGNYIMDPFTTEIGGEIQYLNNGFLAVVALTGGEIKGAVSDPDTRAPAFIGKLGYDTGYTMNGENGIRFRLTGSVYTTSKSNNNTLYGGDRAGSHYTGIIEGGDFSGRFNPNMRNEVTSFMINPFLKINGFEFFGTYEHANGSSVGEPDNRDWDQFGIEGIYRFVNDQLYLGARYNNISGELIGSGIDVTIDRFQLAGGWFITDKVLMKIEYMTQNYDDFPSDQVYNGASFDGIVIEGIVAW